MELYVAKGRFEEALDLCDRYDQQCSAAALVAISSRFFHYQYAKANILRAMGRIHELKGHLETVMKSMPPMPFLDHFQELQKAIVDQVNQGVLYIGEIKKATYGLISGDQVAYSLNRSNIGGRSRTQVKIDELILYRPLTQVSGDR